jgi:hypothetical protein
MADLKGSRPVTKKKAKTVISARPPGLCHAEGATASRDTVNLVDNLREFT